MKSGRALITAAQVLLSLVLGVAAWYLIGALNRLPYSPGRDTLTDLLALPGILIAGLFYPEGVHTGSGSPQWAYILVAGNILVYAAVWFFLIRFITRIHSHRRRG